MGRAIDRLPVDFAEQRVQPRRQSRAADLHSDNDHALTVPPLTPEQSSARRVRALANLDLFGAGDLAEMLGLTEPPKVEVVIAGPKAVPCPQCQAVPGVRCVSSRGKFLGQAHRGRCRRAEAVRAGRQTEEFTKESA